MVRDYYHNKSKTDASPYVRKISKIQKDIMNRSIKDFSKLNVKNILSKEVSYSATKIVREHYKKKVKNLPLPDQLAVLKF